MYRFCKPRGRNEIDNKTKNQDDTIEFFSVNNVQKWLGEFNAHWAC